jgi:hypothetical protein
MSNIGRTVRGAYQLKNQVEAIVTTRLKWLKSIDDRLRNGIFDPDADMRDFDEYLRVVSAMRREKEKMWPGLGDCS